MSMSHEHSFKPAIQAKPLKHSTSSPPGNSPFIFHCLFCIKDLGWRVEVFPTRCTRQIAHVKVYNFSIRKFHSINMKRVQWLSWTRNFRKLMDQDWFYAQIWYDLAVSWLLIWLFSNLTTFQGPTHEASGGKTMRLIWSIMASWLARAHLTTAYFTICVLYYLRPCFTR